MSYLNRLALSLLTLPCILACSLPSTPLLSRENASRPIVDPVECWSKNNTHFTTAFYPHAQQSEGNFVFSPLSLQLGMSLCAEIALGETQKEILNICHLPTSGTIRQKGAKKILNQLNSSSDALSLYLSNGAWIASSNELNPKQEKLLSKYYKAGIFKADFLNNSEQARTDINHWISDNTEQMIQNILAPGSIQTSTKVVLVNTLYMHAQWKKPFSTDLTYNAPFYTSANSNTQIPFMRQTAHFGIHQEADHIAIELPFKKDKSTDTVLALYVVLPNENISISTIETQMSSSHLKHLFSSMESERIDLSLPKFKISSELNAKKILQSMGLSTPFSSKATFDLSNLNPNEQMVISDILHNAIFEIDEVGGKGAAATVIVMRTTSMMPTPPKSIVVNRPFLIYVADKTTGMILFAGRVSQPTQK